jgi:hypothetical protein
VQTVVTRSADISFERATWPGWSTAAPALTGDAGARCQDLAVRTDPPDSGPEPALLYAFLDFQPETLLPKTGGLTQEQLAQLPSSTLTLAGLLHHLALVEDTWFRVRFAGLAGQDLWSSVDWDADPDREFRTATELDPAGLRSRYTDACARSREIVARADGTLGDQLRERHGLRPLRRLARVVRRPRLPLQPVHLPRPGRLADRPGVGLPHHLPRL